MSENLDFLSMATVMLRMRLSAPAVVAVMVLRRAPEGMECCELVRMGGLSQTVAYRTLRYLEAKGMVRCDVQKDFYRRRVAVWRLSRKGAELADSMQVFYARVVDEWERRWRVQQGGRL